MKIYKLNKIKYKEDKVKLFYFSCYAENFSRAYSIDYWVPIKIISLEYIGFHVL